MKKNGRNFLVWSTYSLPDIDPKFNKKNLVKFLEDNGVQTRNYFAGNLLMHPAYKGLDDPHNFPNALQVLDKYFCWLFSVITKEMMIILIISFPKF